tara:strand:+ start:516 stop:803 length:288 start_codon:yes stop_codon:yes gene_type:complete
MPITIILDNSTEDLEDGEACHHEVALAPGVARSRSSVRRVDLVPKPLAKQYSFENESVPARGGAGTRGRPLGSRLRAHFDWKDGRHRVRMRDGAS